MKNARLLLGLLALAGCNKDSRGIPTVTELETRIVNPAGPPPEATVTTSLAYEPIATELRELDEAAAGARVTSGTAAVASGTLVRIFHVSDAQIREERARLVAFGRTPVDELPGSSLFTPAETGTATPLIAANTQFIWLGLALTANEIHRRTPLDLVLHTGDATDVNLLSELYRFLHVAKRFEAPFFMVAGNHDVLGWGIWPRNEPALGGELDPAVKFESPLVGSTFMANDDRPILAPLEHRQAVADVMNALGPHAPTAQLGSSLAGYDLAPAPNGLYYTKVLVPAAGGRPGVQLIVIETNRDDGGAEAEMDDAQFAWLEGVLASPATQENLVIVAGHHPFVTRRSDVAELVSSFDLGRVQALLQRHPNVVAYLTGHTHRPELVEIKNPDGSLAFVQINPGAVFVPPFAGSLFELALDGANVNIDARLAEPAIEGGSKLAGHIDEARAAAAAGAPEARVGAPGWSSYHGTKALPAALASAGN